MGKKFVYVDNSNVYIEGCRVSAVKKRMAGAETITDAIFNRIIDFKWHVDYGKLYEIVCGNSEEIGGANLWGSPPPGDSFWDMVEANGFSVETYDKNAAGKEKKVDVAIAYKITKDVYSGVIDKDEDTIVLLSGDGDYTPVVSDLVAEGYNVTVSFWGHASKELKEAASSFVCLDAQLEALTEINPPVVE